MCSGVRESPQVNGHTSCSGVREREFMGQRSLSVFQGNKELMVQKFI